MSVPAEPVVAPVPLWRRKLLVVGAVVVLSIAYLVHTATQASAVYYLTVGELRQTGAGVSQPVRVSGNVVGGSVERDGTIMRFAVADADGQLPVVYKGVVPDLFGPDVQVVVEGRYADGVFRATTLLAKCPSKFESDPAGAGV
jgi:cytochrome c-type biogenesis protein CcmE